MWRRCLLSGMAVWLAAATPASAFIAYVSNEKSNTVSVIDTDKWTVTNTIKVGQRPRGIEFTRNGKFVLVDARPRFAEFKRDNSEVWVSSEIGGTVSIIDPVKRTITGKINFSIPGLRSEAIQPVGISITKDGKTGFVALGPANRVAVVDAATHAVTKYLLVGQRVWHMAFTPDEKYLLVTNGVSNDVSVIDVSAQKVIKTIQVGELPWGITFAQP